MAHVATWHRSATQPRKPSHDLNAWEQATPVASRPKTIAVAFGRDDPGEKMAFMTNIKKWVRVTAFTALEYDCTVEVVGDPPQDAIQELADALYDEVDGCMYNEVENYWERGSSDILDAQPDSPAPTYRATWTGDEWELEML